jgi:hypothetical protein
MAKKLKTFQMESNEEINWENSYQDFERVYLFN